MTTLSPNAAILATMFYLAPGPKQWPGPMPATGGAGRVAAPDAAITVPVYAAGVAGCCHAITRSLLQSHAVASARRQGAPRQSFRHRITATLMLLVTTALLAMFPRSELVAGLTDYRASRQPAGNLSAPPDVPEILARDPDGGLSRTASNGLDRLEYSGQRQ